MKMRNFKDFNLLKAGLSGLFLILLLYLAVCSKHHSKWKGQRQCAQ